MSPEDFRNIAQGLQAILLSIGALLAGGWAVYTFRTLLSVQKAKAELSRLEAEFEKTSTDLLRIKKEIENRPSLDVEITPSILGSHGSGEFYINNRINIKNTGNTPEFIDWRKSIIRASLVKGVDGDEILTGGVLRGVIGRIGSSLYGVHLWPGEKSSEESMISIEEHGVYMISVSILVSSSAFENIITSAGVSVHDKDHVIVSVGSPLYIDTRKLIND